MKYVDLVLCQNCGLKRLYQAPAFSHLKDGDSIIVEACGGESMVEVLEVYTVDEENEVFDFIIKATGARLPLNKVLKRLVYDELKYEVEQNEPDNT